MKLNKTMIAKLLYVGSFLLMPLEVLAEDDMETCFAIADINAKVACYDNLVHPEQNISDSTSQTPAVEPPESDMTSIISIEPVVAVGSSATTEQAELEEATRIEQFGQEALIDTSDESEDVLIDTVVAINATVPNKLQITLANGQIWKQTIGKIFRLNEGDSVRIYRSGWGKSYRLGKEDKPGFIQVIRRR